MVELVAQAASSPDFSETALRHTLGAIAARAFASEGDIDLALATGWSQGIRHAMADGILTREEETRLRDFREQLAIENSAETTEGATTLERASADRLMLDARLAALATEPGGSHLQGLHNALNESSLSIGGAPPVIGPRLGSCS